METEAGPAVRFFVRADSPVPAQRRRVIDQLERLCANGSIDSYTTEMWPGSVSLDDYQGQPADPVLETITDIEAWADREGVSVSPPIEVRTQEWTVTGEVDRQLTTPHMGLAIFEESELRGFYPHRVEDEVRTIADGLERLGGPTEELRTTRERPDTVLEVNQ